MVENVSQCSGWITFAGVMALVVGVYNSMSGIAALADDDALAARADEVLYWIDLTAWGWFWLVVGLVQIVTGVLIFQRNTWGLWLGVGFAALSAMMTVIVMFVFPLWAMAVLALDFLVLFGLLTQSDEFLYLMPSGGRAACTGRARCPGPTSSRHTGAGVALSAGSSPDASYFSGTRSGHECRCRSARAGLQARRRAICSQTCAEIDSSVSQAVPVEISLTRKAGTTVHACIHALDSLATRGARLCP